MLNTSTTEPLPACPAWDVPRSPFIDYTAWPTPQIAAYQQKTGLDGFRVGFLSTQPGGAKKLLWGGSPTVVDAASEKSLSGDATTSDYGKTDFAAFRKAGGQVILSFGGASNVPLEAEETDVANIVSAYEGVLGNYPLNYLDFDFEGGFIGNIPALERHTAAIAQIIRGNPGLKLSYTLPVDGAPGLMGFNPDGVLLLQRLASAGIQPSLINGMSMEFGQGSSTNLFEASVGALNGMFTQIRSIWPSWNESQVWQHIGICPMFGRNNNGKVFTLENMHQLSRFAADRKIGCLSGWDATRDMNGTTGATQEPYAFSKIIARYRK